MKKLIFILMILIAVPFTGIAKPKLSLGYWIVTQTQKEGYKTTGTTEIIDVYAIAEIYTENACIDFGKVLSESMFYESRIESKYFYVELKKIKQNGKYRSLSKRDIKKLLYL